MSIEAFQSFRAAIEADPALQAAVGKAMAAGQAGVAVQIANDRGFQFTADEAQQALSDSGLSDFELELVSGGNLSLNSDMK